MIQVLFVGKFGVLIIFFCISDVMPFGLSFIQLLKFYKVVFLMVRTKKSSYPPYRVVNYYFMVHHKQDLFCLLFIF